MDQVPCLRIENMSAAEKRAYVLADNKLPLNAGWDEEILAEELQALGDIDFDIASTGFSIPEIDGLIEGLKPEEPGDPEDDLLPSEGPACCRPGDLWQLGRHRLICGNALEPGTVAALMNGERAQMVFTDPPYNVPIHGVSPHGVPATRGGKRRRLDTPHMHGLAPHERDAGGSLRRVQRVQELDCLGQG